MENTNIMESLIDLDSKAREISEKRKEQLLSLSQKFKEEEQNIIKDYKKQIEEETRSITQDIEQKAKQEIGQIILENNKLLENMQKKFDKNLNSIIDEIMERIFKFKKNDNG